MPPLPTILEKYIIKTNEKINKHNTKVYCKSCINEFGQTEGLKNFFPDKTDWIISHLKKCPHFVKKTIAEVREEIFKLVDTSKQGKFIEWCTFCQQSIHQQLSSPTINSQTSLFHIQLFYQ